MLQSGLFSEAQVESLRSKNPPLPTVQGTPTTTSNSFGALQEQPEGGKNKAKWHFNPLFAPSSEDVFITELATQLPEKAFADWWTSPPATMQEAEDRIQAAAKITQNRKDFYADQSLRTPESVQAGAAAVVRECHLEHAPPGKRAKLSEDTATQAPGARSEPPGPPPNAGDIPCVRQTTYNITGGGGNPTERAHSSPADSTGPKTEGKRGDSSPGRAKKAGGETTRTRSRSPIPREDKAPKGKGARSKPAAPKPAAAAPTFKPEMVPHEGGGWTPHNKEVLRLYVQYFNNEVLFTRMEASEIEEYTQEIREAVEANDGEKKRLDAEAASAEEAKRAAASYKEAVITSAANMGSYKNSQFPRLQQPHRFQGIPQPQNSAVINAANARLAASRPAEAGG